MTCLILTHIGDRLPEYFIDCIYQSCIVNSSKSPIYLLVSKKCIPVLQIHISKLKTDTSFIHIYKIENFENEKINKFTTILQTKNFFKNIKEFRDGFWVYTILRFFIIQSFMEKLNLTNVLHLENDVMLYLSFEKIINIVKNIDISNNKICCVSDAPKRAIASILYIPNINSINDFVNYIINVYENTQEFVNDMDLLGSYNNKITFPISPSCENPVIFDGACIGQYLGGIDPKNTNGKNTVGFINETSIINPSNYNYYKKMVVRNDGYRYKLFMCKNKTDVKNNLSIIANLHIHSKQLFNFSSCFDIRDHDIISGDKIFGNCDFIISTPDICNFHKNLTLFNNDIFIVDNYKTCLKKFIQKLKNVKKNIVKIGIYTHELENYQKYFLNSVENVKIKYYIHNSDHVFNDNYKDLINHPTTFEIYTQNINIEQHPKVFLLPIGIANSMWDHGNCNTLYKTMIDSYKYKKDKDIYLNINTETFPYRKTFINNIRNYKVSEKTNFENYLKTLAEYKFALCIRGNGIDTHRFWECLYLKTIPVIIVNEFTEMNGFYEYLKNNNIVHFKISCAEEFNNVEFNQKLYDEIMKDYTSEKLKLQYYTN